MKRILLNTTIALAVTVTALTTKAAVGTVSGPFAYRNLQIFLIHGDTGLDQRHYATLAEGLENGFVVIKETGNVEELSVENSSKATTVFLNAGDIIKGGRQDRTVRDDLILPPQSGKVPLAAFCVEHGRWTKRGEENPAAFSANTKSLSSKKQRIAARYALSQSDVWSGVAEEQTRLNENVSRLAGKRVETRSAASASSLQLTLENKDLEAVRKRYLEQLNSILDGKNDVKGFAYAINGEINSAEVYGNKQLFRALWPKLLDAAVTEAIAENKEGAQFQSVEAIALKGFFETALAGSAKERQVWKSTRVKVYTTPTTLLFETLDLEADGACIHKSFINKGTQTVVVPLDRDASQYQEQLRPRPVR
jgi:hypothetical protein